MTDFTRRALVQSGTASAARLPRCPARPCSTGPRPGRRKRSGNPKNGAKLSMLRWKYFVQSEDDAFVKLIDAFTKATGVKVDISRESYEDVQPKASVAANTGTGPDLFWGLYSLPHLVPAKMHRYDRRHRLPRQEVWRLGRQRRQAYGKGDGKIGSACRSAIPARS